MNGRLSEIEFLKAKNGELTCSLSGRYFHSAYNPQKEAQTFCNSAVSPFTPSCIIIIEPALSYCEKFLREKFPGAELIAVRLTHGFENYNGAWDKVFYFCDERDFSQTLYGALGEEKLLSSLLLIWTGSRAIFPAETEKALEEIKKSILLSRDVISTRRHFSEKWFLNSVTFCRYVKNVKTVSKIKKDILITASGPSLKSSIEKIKEFRDDFYLIALSSSVSVLVKNRIIPDMVLSTDGGFWAKKHLEFSKEDFSMLKDTVFAFTDEACCPKKILKNNRIFPLCYENSAGEKLFEKLNIPHSPALRNGTVSGTAAFLALALTEKNIYFCGLDLSPAGGFQHTQPNRLELRAENRDFRLNPKEKRQTLSRFNSAGALEIYRNWFKNQQPYFYGRIFRLSDHFNFSASLEPMADKKWEDVSFCKTNGNSTFTEDFSVKTDTRKLLHCVEDVLKDEKIVRELFPLESLLIKRETDLPKRQELEKSLETQLEHLKQKCMGILNV